jgi:hypothetical protein
MDAYTITGSSVTLSGPGGAVTALVAYNATSRTVTLTPSAPLSSNSTYTATLAASVAAADGTPLGTADNWSFTTLAGPTVTAVTPAAGSSYVARTVAATATFSRDMDPATLTSSSVTIAAPVRSPSRRASATTPPPARHRDADCPARGRDDVHGDDRRHAKAADGALLRSRTWTFTTAACPCTLFPDVLQPAATGIDTQDGRSGNGPFSYELGTKFTGRPADAADVLPVLRGRQRERHPRGQALVLSGVLLAQQTFAGETPSGWQQQALAAPVTLQPNVTYVVSINANAFFVTTLGGLASQIVSGPVRTVADGANGVFGSSAGTFPNQTFGSTNYFADAVVVPNGDQARSACSRQRRPGTPSASRGRRR